MLHLHGSDVFPSQASGRTRCGDSHGEAEQKLTHMDPCCCSAGVLSFFSVFLHLLLTDEGKLKDGSCWDFKLHKVKKFFDILFLFNVSKINKDKDEALIHQPLSQIMNSPVQL